jgi:bifunctional non-homologous end joining protein LigD
MPAEGAWHVGGERGDDLKLTNLDKTLFGPPAGDAAVGPVTKRELIGYFARIAPTMLPHLAERPLNLQRFPNGADGPSFWQKDIPASAPGWLRRWHEVGVDEREDRKANEHLIADRVATLCWLGNQAAFEVHARPSSTAPFCGSDSITTPAVASAMATKVVAAGSSRRKSDPNSATCSASVFE